MEAIPKMSGVLRGNCCENTYEGVYQEDFFNKADAFLERLQELLIKKRNI